MKLYYDDILLGEVVTNQSLTVENCVEILAIDMNEYAESQGWDDWDYGKLRVEA